MNSHIQESKAPANAPKQAAATEPTPPLVQPRPLGELLDAVEGFLRKWVVFPLREQATVISLWVAHTWVIEAFDFTPYLHVFSAEKRSGKSRTLDVVELLAKNAWRGGGETEAVMFRKIKANQPTLLADEIDTVFHAKKNDGNENIRRMYNLGFTRGYVVSRCVGTNTKFEIEEFDPFCAKALCGIGRCLPDTVADRSLPIELVRHSGDQRAARFRKRDATDETLPVKKELEAWAGEQGLIEKLRGERPEIPAGIQDRQEEICEPLLVIADLAGGQWPVIARAALVKLCSQEEDASIGVMLLGDIKRVFDEAGTDKMSTIDILNKLVAIEDDRPWAAWWLDDLKHDKAQKPAARLAKMLKSYKIKAQVVRVGDETPRGYVREHFRDAWERNLPGFVPPSGKAATSATSATLPQNTRENEGCASSGESRNVAHSVPEAATRFYERKSVNVAGVAAVAPCREGEGKGLTKAELDAMSDEEFEVWCAKTKAVHPYNEPEWVQLFPDEAQPHWQAAFREAEAKRCEVCREPGLCLPDTHYWFNIETKAVRCQSCQETQWWADGYEIDSFGVPSCWSHRHTREQRIAERTRNQIQKVARYRAQKAGLDYFDTYQALLAQEPKQIRRMIEQL